MLRQNIIYILKIALCMILAVGVLPPFTLFLNANAQDESNFSSEKQSNESLVEDNSFVNETDLNESSTKEDADVNETTKSDKSTDIELNKEFPSKTYKDNEIIFSEFIEEEQNEESAINPQINLSQHNVNEIDDCAYFIKEPFGVYAVNTLYFYGQKIDELEKASLTDKVIKCKWENGLDLPYEIKILVQNVIFDESAIHIQPKSLYYFFSNFENCESFDCLNYLDTSFVKTMEGMFFECNKVKNLDLPFFNLSNVESMHNMFINCYSLINITFSKTANANKVVNLDNFCNYCVVLESIVLPRFGGASVKFMERMFNQCLNLKSIDFNDFDSSNVNNMNCLFKDCHSLEYMDLSHWNTSNVTNMGAMFSWCLSLKLLNLSEFDTSKVNNMSGMFHMCGKLKTIYVKEKFTIDKLSRQDTMFEKCTSLVGGAGTTYNSSRVYPEAACTDIDINGTWGIDKGYFTKIVGVAYFVSENVGSYKANTLYFLGHTVPELEQAVANKQANKFLYENTGQTSIFSEIADRCTNVVFDESVSWVSPSSTYAWFDNFKNCESIEGLNYLDTSSVTNMGSMFKNCQLFSEINLANFSTTNVENMAEMFSGCTSINNLDLSTFNTAKVNNMAGMFANCPELIVLNLENFNTANVENMSEMFNNNYNLKTIYATELFSTAKVTKSNNMFKDCFALVGGGQNKYDPDHIDILAACIDKAGKQWGVDRGYFTCRNYTPEPPKEDEPSYDNNSDNFNESLYESINTGETNTLLLISLILISLAVFGAYHTGFKKLKRLTTKITK